MTKIDKLMLGIDVLAITTQFISGKKYTLNVNKSGNSMKIELKFPSKHGLEVTIQQNQIQLPQNQGQQGYSIAKAKVYNAFNSSFEYP